MRGDSVKKRPVKEIEIQVEQRPGVVRRIWVTLQQPRAITGLMVLLYLSLAVISGAGGLYQPSPNAVAGLGLYLSWAVASFYVLGGSVGTIAAWAGWWAMERGALVFIITALLARIINAIYLIAAGQVTGQYMYLGGAFALLFALLGRYLRIRGAQLDPAR